MDTHWLNYHYAEHFPTFEQDEFLNMDESEGNMGLSTGEDIWEWEVERELNGDIAIIPVSSNIGMECLSNSPPVKEDFQKILSDWQNFIEADGDTENLEWNMLDYVDKKPIVNNNVNRSMGKKIDMSAKCYIVENEPLKIKLEPIDIEEEPIEDLYPAETLEDLYPAETVEDMNKPDVPESLENDYVDVDTISENDSPILEAGDVDSLLEQFEATEQNHISIEQTPSSNDQTDTEKRTQILNSLPPELIQRIKASSQRRIVPVIDAKPTKKRSKKCHAEAPVIPLVTPVKVEPISEMESSSSIKLEHAYCASSTTLYPKNPKKDSGFESAEEDEQRNILRNQLTVKDASGRLMISLLKANTIHNNIVTESSKDREKRKLNLEEYKKRRKDVAGLSDNSKNNSPPSSGYNSPTVIEDEKLRLIKHQQKLQQMAADVLTTPPRSKVPTTTVTNATLPNVSAIPPPTPTLPENIEVKVLVSIGVNTDEVPELKEIRPILKHAIDKIDSNSLISSVIKNIQIKKEKELQEVPTDNKTNEHGEDKTIVYLDKCREPASTRNVSVQVDMTLPEDEVIGKHRRSSIKHRTSYKRRSTSNESNNSCSSVSSSSTRSRSRSPTNYKAFKRSKLMQMEQEHLREVEERRIVYIGGISLNTTKDDLRKRFQQFGPITNTSIHFRDYGHDNYGFVTFAYPLDAYNAIERGNDDPTVPAYDLSFGGRRIFCGSNYSDLDNVHEYSGYSAHQEEDSFDNLLREAQAKLRKRKS